MLTKTAAMMPIASVMAKPRTGPLVYWYRAAAASRVVTLASMIADSEWPKPLRMATRSPLPARNSSRMRSKLITFPSTAAPIVSTRPARPGSVRAAPRPARMPKMNSIATRRPSDEGAAEQRTVDQQDGDTTALPPMAAAVVPAAMESRPSVGPIALICSTWRAIGSDPERRTSAVSAASSRVGMPVICPESLMREFRVGRGLDLPVEHDRHAPADVAAGEVAEGARVLGADLEEHGGAERGRADALEVRARRPDDLAGEGDVLEVGGAAGPG